PGFLAVEGIIVLCSSFRTTRLTARRIGREVLRLAPFAIVIAIYLAVRLPILRTVVAPGGTYRVSTDWHAILNNLRMLPLMTIRVFYLAGYKVEWRSYLETPLSN